MKRERTFDSENSDSTNFNKKLDRVIDNENKQKHTIWCLSQGQKYLNKIIKEYCSLCNKKIINKNKINNELKCSYCNKTTCGNNNCLLNQCTNCELPICNLCGNYNYDSRDVNLLFLCPECN